MRKTLFLFILVMLLGLTLGISACSPTAKAEPVTPNTPTAEPPKAMETFTDPFAYCTAAGTIDQPDARYSGEKTPDVIIQGYIKAAGLNNTSEPAEMFKKATIWRCMDKKVYVCNFGANLPCDSKANTDKTPTQAMADFCKENNGADFFPMNVTGHSTIYSWHCVKDAPTLLDQIDKVDAAGYLERIWYPIEPGK